MFEGWGFGCVAAPGPRHLLSGAPGGPSPRVTGLSGAGGRFALRTPPSSVDCSASAWSGALGRHLRSPRRGKNRRTGFGALGRPGSSLPPSPSSTLRFGEDFRAVLFSLLPSIFIFQGSDSSLALGVEIRWRDQISARLCVRVCVGLHKNPASIMHDRG